MTFRLPVLGINDLNFPDDGQTLTYNVPQDKFEWKYGTLIFGSMYIEAELQVSITGTSPTEVKDATADGWTAGKLNRITFPTGGDEHYLTITKPGIYEVLWGISVHTDSGGNTQVHAGVMIDGVAVMDNGESHRTVANTNDTGDMSKPCIADLPNGNEEISLWVVNDLGNDLHIVHATMTAKLIGET